MHAYMNAHSLSLSNLIYCTSQILQSQAYSTSSSEPHSGRAPLLAILYTLQGMHVPIQVIECQRLLTSLCVCWGSLYIAIHSSPLQVLLLQCMSSVINNACSSIVASQ